MKISECCSAGIKFHDICMECGEHCLSVTYKNRFGQSKKDTDKLEEDKGLDDEQKQQAILKFT